MTHSHTAAESAASIIAELHIAERAAAEKRVIAATEASALAERMAAETHKTVAHTATMLASERDEARALVATWEARATTGARIAQAADARALKAGVNAAKAATAAAEKITELTTALAVATTDTAALRSAQVITASEMGELRSALAAALSDASEYGDLASTAVAARASAREAARMASTRADVAEAACSIAISERDAALLTATRNTLEHDAELAAIRASHIVATAFQTSANEEAMHAAVAVERNQFNAVLATIRAESIAALEAAKADSDAVLATIRAEHIVALEMARADSDAVLAARKAESILAKAESDAVLAATKAESIAAKADSDAVLAATKAESIAALEVASRRPETFDATTETHQLLFADAACDAAECVTTVDMGTDAEAAVVVLGLCADASVDVWISTKDAATDCGCIVTKDATTDCGSIIAQQCDAATEVKPSMCDAQVNVFAAVSEMGTSVNEDKLFVMKDAAVSTSVITMNDICIGSDAAPPSLVDASVSSSVTMNEIGVGVDEPTTHADASTAAIFSSTTDACVGSDITIHHCDTGVGSGGDTLIQYSDASVGSSVALPVAVRHLGTGSDFPSAAGTIITFADMSCSTAIVLTSDAASSSYATETFDAACDANPVCHSDAACDALPLPPPCVDCPLAIARALSSETHSTTLAAELSAVFDALNDRDVLLDAANVAIARARAGEGEALDTAGTLSDALRTLSVNSAIEAETARTALAASEARVERAALRAQTLRETLAQVARDADEAVACARSSEAAAETRAATATRSAVVARARSEELVAALGLMTTVLRDGGAAVHAPIDATRLAAVREALAGSGGREGGGELAESITALAASVGAGRLANINNAAAPPPLSLRAVGASRLTSPANNTASTTNNTNTHTPRSPAASGGGRLRAQGRVRSSALVVAPAVVVMTAVVPSAAAVVTPISSPPPPPPLMRALSTLSQVHQQQQHHQPLDLQDEGLISLTTTTPTTVVSSSCVTIPQPPSLPRTRSHTPSSSSMSLTRTTPQTHLSRGVTNQVTSPRALVNLR